MLFLGYEIGVDLAGLDDGKLEQCPEGGRNIGNVIGKGIGRKIPEGYAPEYGATLGAGPDLEPEAHSAGCVCVCGHGLHLLSVFGFDV